MHYTLSALIPQRRIQDFYPMPDRNRGHTLNMRQTADISGGNNIGPRTFQCIDFILQ